MAQLTVACVIPTHGRDAELQRALDSVTGQTHRPHIVIVVDDIGSAATRRLVEQSGDDLQVTYLDHSSAQHKGASSSRNAGAARAPIDTDVFAFLDDDDRWEPRFLESCLHRLESTEAALVATWASMELDTGVVTSVWSARDGLTAQLCVARNPGVTGSNLTIRRDAFVELGGFDASLPVYNDLDFFVRFLEHGWSYSIVAERLVVQSATGADHLSSRGRRRAQGIESYIAKHRDKLSAAQLRWLRRDRHLAQRFPGQKPHLKAYHFVMMWLRSSPEQFRIVVSNRLRSRHRMYG